jgi:hypothetical protein
MEARADQHDCVDRTCRKAVRHRRAHEGGTDQTRAA